MIKDLASGAAQIHCFPTFSELLKATRDCAAVGVDVPIGLLDGAIPGGRACDREARGRLGAGRGSSVFSPPTRPALAAADYPAALAANRASSEYGLGLSKQCYNIFPKIREVDALMTPHRQRRVREVHPELCFIALNGGQMLPDGKKTETGRAVRSRLLVENGFPEAAQAVARAREFTAAPDDVLDAFAACWTAARIADGEAERLPRRPEKDGKGLRMEMWV